MSRIARRLRVSRVAAPTLPPPAEIRLLDTAVRGRAARAVRARLRRMDPVVLVAPPWAAVPRFLEDLSLDLAVGEPAVGCRVVSFRSAYGRPKAEVWQLALQLFSQLGQRGWYRAAPTTVADRRGFRYAMESVLERAHRESPHRVALLARDVEALPVDVLEDIAAIWSGYRERHAVERRCSVVLGTTESAGWLKLGSAPRVELVDFASDEATASLLSSVGPMPEQDVKRVTHLTGGIPALVDAVAATARRTGHLPTEPRDVLECLGPVAGELRTAVDHAIALDPLADRLTSLRPGEPDTEAPDVDTPLLRAGLVRRVRAPGGDKVELRAPILHTLIG